MATISEALAAALEHHKAGRLAAAESIYRRILAVDPNQPDALNLLGVIAHEAGRHDLACEYIRKAVSLNENEPIFHNNLGNVLKALEKRSEAMAAYERALQLNPNFAKARYNLAIALKEEGRLDEAVVCSRQAVESMPEDAEAHNHFGNTLKAKGSTEEAVACYHRALEIDPNYVEALNNLGIALRDSGKAEEAIACFRRALEMKPDLIEAKYNLALTLRDRGQVDEAMACYHEILEKKRNDARACNSLGNALMSQGMLDESIAYFHKAIEIEPDYGEAFHNLAIALKDQGRLDEAIESCRTALRHRPELSTAHGNQAYMLYFSPDYDARAIADEHFRWRERFADPLGGSIRPHANDRSPGRRLRIGYVSPDFRFHPVGRFIWPLLDAHDREQFEVFAYSSVRTPDGITEASRGAVATWRNVMGLSDEGLAETIRQDRIDILVDLTMHMADNRMLMFARKPAPIQVTYLAYCGTTGLDTIDYRLTDPHLDPPGGDASIYSEKSMHLPETYWCYRPTVEAPPVGALPSIAARHITFACLNNFCKVSPPALDAWTKILKSVPESELIVHARPGSHCRRVIDCFERAGIEADRVKFQDFVPIYEFFRVHERIDIALDPFPYGGGTTTFDALWMGVPLVTLRGPTAVGRGGASILSNLGLDDLIAEDVDGYVEIAVQLARNTLRLAGLRASLRDRMRRSPLMDAPRFARNVESCYLRMWQDWCSGTLK